jgi:phosphoribosylaminoimidazole carboxylase PurK protein
MLTSAASPLGFKTLVMDSAPNCPAAQVGATQIDASLDDIAAIHELAERSDVLTWEIEHIPADYLAALAEKGANIEPSPRTLLVIQDKLLQKQFLQSRGLPVAPFGEPNALSSVNPGPYVVKSRKGGYDGRGNLLVNSLSDSDIHRFFGDQPVYVEQVVPFDKEISVIAARDIRGNIRTYPAVETVHKDNICHLVVAPANVDSAIRAEASEIAEAVLTELEGAGVFAIEMFVSNGRVLVNEIAPRVHNSGHLTIEANITSQFEQHIRAVTGMPLGDPGMRVAGAVMINVLGRREEPLSRVGLERLLSYPDTHVHFYGKSSRSARKIGHITVVGDEVGEILKIAQQAREELVV